MAYNSNRRYSNPESRKRVIEENNKNFKTKIFIGTVALAVVILLVIYFAVFSPFNKGKKGDTTNTSIATSIVTTAVESTSETTENTSVAEDVSTTKNVESSEAEDEVKTTIATTKNNEATTENIVPADATPDHYVFDDGIPSKFNKAETKKWYLKLIGPYSDPLPKDYAPSLSTVDGYPIHSKIVTAYKAMKKAAKKDGVNLYIISGYRTYQRQKNNFNTRYNLYKSQGYSDDEAYKKTAAIIAVPGTSEHHLGLAMDLNSLDQSFGNTKAGKWLAKNSYKYGFILRYAADTTDITGIVYEPWHFRYVSVGHAYKIREMDVTLEEYIEWLKSQE
jgi:D-alanyl-D-alanine carboxypeptidase